MIDDPLYLTSQCGALGSQAPPDLSYGVVGAFPAYRARLIGHLYPDEVAVLEEAGLYVGGLSKQASLLVKLLGQLPRGAAVLDPSTGSSQPVRVRPSTASRPSSDGESRRPIQ